MSLEVVLCKGTYHKFKLRFEKEGFRSEVIIDASSYRLSSWMHFCDVIRNRSQYSLGFSDEETISWLDVDGKNLNYCLESKMGGETKFTISFPLSDAVATAFEQVLNDPHVNEELAD